MRKLDTCNSNYDIHNKKKSNYILLKKSNRNKSKIKLNLENILKTMRVHFDA